MQLRFGHFSLRPADLEASARFYVEALGLIDGYRPPFGFPGKWLYLGNEAILHLIGSRDLAIGVDPKDFIDKKALADYQRGSGAVDHIALCAARDELEQIRERFEGLGVRFVERAVPLSDVTQFFVEDPDGVTVEIMFSD